MAISSLGVGSGLDAEGIISALMTVEKRPLTVLQGQEKSLKTKLSSFGQLQSLTSDLQVAARNLESLTLWRQVKASSSDESVAKVQATPGAGATSFSMRVMNLAAPQGVVSSSYPQNSAGFADGSLTIELGSWSTDSDGAPVFAPQADGRPKTLELGPAPLSLESIRDRINASGAGVTASLVKDVTGSRLTLASSQPGATNGFRILSENAGTSDPSLHSLTALSYDPRGTSSGMRLTQPGRDAVAMLNGIEVRSSSNTFQDVLDGVSVVAQAASDRTLQMSVGTDTDAIKSAVDAFVKAFNGLSSFIRTQTKYDSTSKTAAPLQGHSTVVGLLGKLRAALNQPLTMGGGKFSRLSDVGITMKADNTLEVKSSKLTDLMSNASDLEGLRRLFVTDGDRLESAGFAVRYRQLAGAMLADEGGLTTANNGLSERVKRLQKQQDAINDRLSGTESRLRKQYEGLDRKMSQLNGLSSYVANQMTKLYNSSNK